MLDSGRCGGYGGKRSAGHVALHLDFWNVMLQNLVIVTRSVSVFYTFFWVNTVQITITVSSFSDGV